MRRLLPSFLALGSLCSMALGEGQVPRTHPRLLGARADLQGLVAGRRDAYDRMARIARGEGADDHSQMLSMGLVAAIEGDRALARQAVERALAYVNGPIRKGHETFGHDLALVGLVYDLCHEAWTPEERAAMHRYLNATVDANVDSETHVFHNGWYGYKNWGIGIACYATYYENPRSPAILATLFADYRDRAAPALEMAGAGGGWAEGYYGNYWLYEWLFFCEVARRCEGVEYTALAPTFYRQRAIASMFETYPGIGRYGSRRPMPMGDGGGRVFGGDRDKALSARRILVNLFQGDPAHQAVHAFDETTPRSSVGNYAYKDFLWRDPSVRAGDLDSFKLSHLSPGAGTVAARSSWGEDATHFSFKCGDRFTAHQHLDVGHFTIFRHEELAGDGGHYDAFGSPHDVNYHLRSVAHNTVLVLDPAEAWPKIRAGDVTGNDGGQHHSFPHHNGAVADPAQWLAQREAHDIADLVAFEDFGEGLYVAGDCTRAYSPKKLSLFVRQIVFLRPGTFVVFDRVRSTRPEFRKTWLLQAMKPPVRQGKHLVVTNGKGRLFVQTLVPAEPQVRLASGPDLYRYGGRDYPPSKDTGPAPECRIEVSPSRSAENDLFLHVLTATDAGVARVPDAEVRIEGREVAVTVGASTIVFFSDEVGGRIVHQGRTVPIGRRLVGR